MTHSLAALLAEEAASTLTVPESWRQGRTAYGGLSAALALAAAMREGGDLPPLRSAQVSFVGPLDGAIRTRAQVLRRGRNATWVRADVTREDEIGLAGVFVFMGAVDSRVELDHRPLPAGVIPVGEARPVPTDRSPAFLQHHYDVRFALPPAKGKKLPETCWWVRLRERDGLDPMVHLMAVADAVPPGVLPLLPPRAPVSSMTWQCNLLHPSPATEEGWWLLRVTGGFARSGGASDAIDIWNTQGVPMMAALQSVAVFG